MDQSSHTSESHQMENSVKKLKGLMQEIFDTQYHLQLTQEYVTRIKTYWEIYSHTVDEIQIILNKDEAGILSINSLFKIICNIKREIGLIDNRGYFQRMFFLSSYRKNLEGMLAKMKDTFYILYNRNELLRSNIDLRYLEKEIAKQKNPLSIITHPDGIKFARDLKFNCNNEVSFSDFLAHFIKFLDNYSIKVPYNKTSIRFMVNKYVDQNSSGTIDPYEIEDFFANIWGDVKARDTFFKDINTDPKKPQSINEYTLTRQLLYEEDCEKYFEFFVNECLNSNSIMCLGENYNFISNILKDAIKIPYGDCSKISNCIVKFNSILKIYNDIDVESFEIYRSSMIQVEEYRDLDAKSNLKCIQDMKSFNPKYINMVYKGQFIEENDEQIPHGYGKINFEEERMGYNMSYEAEGYFEKGILKLGKFQSSGNQSKVHFIYGEFNKYFEPVGCYYETFMADKNKLKDLAFDYKLTKKIMIPEEESEYNKFIKAQYYLYTCTKHNNGNYEYQKLVSLNDFLYPCSRSYTIDDQKNAMIKFWSAAYERELERQDFYMELKTLEREFGHGYNDEFDIYFAGVPKKKK